MEKNFELTFIKEMQLRGFAESTKKSYVAYTRRFVRSLSKPTHKLDAEDLKEYLHQIIENKSLAPRTINARRSAIIFFLRHVLRQTIADGIVPQLKTPSTLPVVMTQEEVKLLFTTLNNIFYKSLLMVMYSTGLRSQEVRDLKISDIDSKQMVIHIRQGKGQKDRKAMLSPKCLEYLRAYWSKYRKDDPIKSDWLFTPRKSCKGRLDKQLSPTAIAYIVKSALKAAGIKKKSPHIRLGTALQLT